MRERRALKVTLVQTDPLVHRAHKDLRVRKVLMASRATRVRKAHKATQVLRAHKVTLERKAKRER
jgi:hypothetical protein